MEYQDFKEVYFQMNADDRKYRNLCVCVADVLPAKTFYELLKKFMEEYEIETLEEAMEYWE